MSELEDVLKGLSANRIGSVNFGFSLLASLASIVRDVSEDYRRSCCTTPIRLNRINELAGLCNGL